MQFYTRHFGRVCGKITDFSCAKKKKCLVFVSCEKKSLAGRKKYNPPTTPTTVKCSVPYFLIFALSNETGCQCSR
jgi:hypothetical protein